MNKEFVHKFIFEVATERDANHLIRGSKPGIGENYEYVGLLGEWYFSQEFGLPIDLTIKLNGDGNVDFFTKAGTIDVKTARKPFNLIVERGKKVSDIIVLAGYDDETDSIYFVGWEYGPEILKCPTKNFGHGIINHYKPAVYLKSMDELRDLLK